MRKQQILIKACATLGVVVFFALAIVMISTSVSALTESQLEDFAANNIMFYDPGDEEDSTGGCISKIDDSGNGTLAWDDDSIVAVNGALAVASSERAVVTGTTIEEKIWSGLKSLGLTDAVTAGIMGNMVRESGLNPARHETSKRNKYWGNGFDLAGNGNISYGLGLIQWSYGRRIKLYNYVKENAPGLEKKFFDHPETYSTSPVISGASFVEKVQANGDEADGDTLISLELTYLIVKEMRNYGWYKKVFNETTVEGAAARFAINVEACGSCKAGSETVKARAAKAQEFYVRFSGKTKFAGGTGGTGTGGLYCDSDGEDSGSGTSSSSSGSIYGEGGYRGDDYTYKGDVPSLQNWVKTYAWSTWWEKKPRRLKTLQTDAYRNLSGKHGGCYGNDCGGFVAKAIQASGWDTNFKYQAVRYMQTTLYKSSTWTEVTSKINSESDMQPGDIIICSHNSAYSSKECRESSIGHVMLWVGPMSNFGDKIASASWSSDCNNSRAPSASSGKNKITTYIKQDYSIYRKVR